MRTYVIKLAASHQRNEKQMKIELEEVEVESTGGGFDAGIMVVDWLDDSGQYKRIEFLKKR